jgi:hypothetical protein
MAPKDKRQEITTLDIGLVLEDVYTMQWLTPDLSRYRTSAISPLSRD